MSRHNNSFYRKYGKRLFDIVIAGTAIIVLFPFFLIMAFQIRRKLGSPIIFSQVRPGKDGKLFTLYKFRSMTDAKDSAGQLLPDEERLPVFGEKLRNSSLDELPELWNIVKGDMSIVGPRPQLVRDMVFFTSEEEKRQLVYPGLTGLAQISGRNNQNWKERFLFDLQYIKRMSFREDLRIIWHTIFKVTSQADISTEGMATSEDYGDWLLHSGMISEEKYKKKRKIAEVILKKYSKIKDM